MTGLTSEQVRLRLGCILSQGPITKGTHHTLADYLCARLGLAPSSANRRRVELQLIRIHGQMAIVLFQQGFDMNQAGLNTATLRLADTADLKGRAYPRQSCRHIGAEPETDDEAIDREGESIIDICEQLRFLQLHRPRNGHPANSNLRAASRVILYLYGVDNYCDALELHLQAQATFICPGNFRFTLGRLAKRGILWTQFAGKRKVFKLNPAIVLSPEDESCLKLWAEQSPTTTSTAA